MGYAATRQPRGGLTQPTRPRDYPAGPLGYGPKSGLHEWATPKKWADKWADISPQPTHLSARYIYLHIMWYYIMVHAFNGALYTGAHHRYIRTVRRLPKQQNGCGLRAVPCPAQLRRSGHPAPPPRPPAGPLEPRQEGAREEALSVASVSHIKNETPTSVPLNAALHI